MAITVQDAPDNLDLVRNHLWYHLLTDNHLQTQEQKPLFGFTFTGQPNDGDIIYLAWYDKNDTPAAQITLRAKNAPNGMNEFQVGTNQSIDDWTQNTFIPFLKNHPMINAWWTIRFNYDPNDNEAFTYLDMRVFGEMNTYTSLLANTSVYDLTQYGTKPKYRPNFKIGVNVYVDNGSHYELITTNYYKPDLNGNIIFDIADQVKLYLDADMPTSSNIELTKNINRPYYISYFEYYGNPASKRQIYFHEIKYALLGGLPFHLYQRGDFYSYYVEAQKNFLTWKPRKRKITPDQEEWLFMPYNNAHTFNAPSGPYYQIVKIYYEDGTTDKVLHEQISSNYSEFEIAMIPCGLEHAGIDQIDPSKEVRKYEVWVGPYIGFSTAYDSEHVTFYVDRKPYQYTQQFFFVNSLGGVDTLLAVGAKSYKQDVQRNRARYITPIDYGPTFEPTRQLEPAATEVVTVRTGYLNQEEVNWLKDIIHNHQKCLTDLDGQRVSVLINTDSSDLYDEQENLKSLEFEYEYAFDRSLVGAKY